ncbi:hypothetical protein SLS53_000165 [Cytospora paraplurivora]|uniref:Uncharacterized protein n=1 Tax=Cytospora paraplurivora TaxID=2898453 RepID=A0AAN9UJR5_9PEZI
MKRFAKLQSRHAVPGAKSYLQVRTFATKPQTHANSEAADADKPGPDDFLFDDQFEVNVGNKTIDTAAGSLPISPLLDPTWREARNRVTPKERPDKSKLNRFQRSLYQNPYAQLLATPVRSCYVTRTRVPGAFLQSFGLVKHPETPDIWWIPENITQNESESPARGKSTEAEGSQSAATGDGTAPSSDAAPVDAAPAAAETKEVKTTKPKKIFQYPSHVLARQDLLQGFFTNGSKYRGGQFRLASNPLVSGLAKSAIWREDMDSVIVDLSRRQIMHDLLYLSRFCEGEQKRKYMFRVNDAAETQRYVRRWCFLWLGEGTDHTAEAGAHESASGPGKVEEGPGQYATLDIDGISDTTRPIYNLPRLLGPDNIQRLRSESSVLRDGSLFLLRGQRSLRLNQRLWRLQGYIADYSKLK